MRQKRKASRMIDDLKALLGIQMNDTEQDEVLRLILRAVKSRLKILLGGIEPPEELGYIILDVAAVRYNRLGSEGLSSHTVEGESLSLSSNDFEGYTDDIQAFLDARRDSQKGKVKFI